MLLFSKSGFRYGDVDVVYAIITEHELLVARPFRALTFLLFGVACHGMV